MNVIVLIPDQGRLREAIPVRALPHVAPDRLYAERIARELTQVDQCYGRGILRHVQSYQLTEDGKIIEVLPVQWLPILNAVLALSQELDDPQHPRLFDKSGLAIPDPQRDCAYDYAVLGRLPNGVFVWWDEFERVYLKRLRHWSEQQQRDGQLVRYPLISPELHSVIMEGFERFAVLVPPPNEAAPIAPPQPETRVPPPSDWRTTIGQSPTAEPAKPERPIVPFREPERRRDSWADVIIDAIKAFEKENKFTANETQLWTALTASPTAEYHVEWDERTKALKMPDASPMNRSSFSGRFERLYPDRETRPR